MAENVEAVVPQDTRKIALGAGQVVAIVPQTFDEVYRMAAIIVGSGIGPKGMTKEACAVAIMAGAEVGVAPMASVQNIAVINGRPCMWGDLIVALVQASGLLEYLIEEWDEGTQTATVRIKRVRKPEHVETFGPVEAKRGKLADKDLYKQYPQRMHGWRAKSYAIRSQFADVLKGLSIREEVEDYVDVEAVTRAPIAAPRPAARVPDTTTDQTTSDELPQETLDEIAINAAEIAEALGLKEPAYRKSIAAAKADGAERLCELRAGWSEMLKKQGK